MKPMDIDFAPTSWQRSLAQIHPLSWGLLVLALIFSLFVLMTAKNITAQRQEQQQELQNKQSRLFRRAPPPPPVPRRTTPEPQVRAVNLAILQLNLPWRDLLNALEDGTPKTIAFISIEPDAKKQALKGVAEAADSEAMLDFISQLKQQKFFDQVNLSKHEINEQDPNKPLRFQFEAHWGGP
jgi:Tfp pilus assembly protein PilN